MNNCGLNIPKVTQDLEFKSVPTAKQSLPEGCGDATGFKGPDADEDESQLLNHLRYNPFGTVNSPYFSPFPSSQENPYITPPSPMLDSMFRTDMLFQETQQNFPPLSPFPSPNMQASQAIPPALPTKMVENSSKKRFWKPHESNALLDLISQNIDFNRIKWGEIKFKGFSRKQCQQHFQYIKNHPKSFPRYEKLGLDKIFSGEINAFRRAAMKSNQQIPVSFPVHNSPSRPSVVSQPAVQTTSSFSKKDFPFVDDFFLSFSPSPSLQAQAISPYTPDNMSQISMVEFQQLQNYEGDPSLESLNPSESFPETPPIQEDAFSPKETAPLIQEDVKTTPSMKSMQTHFKLDVKHPSRWHSSESNALLYLINQNIVNKKVQWNQFISDLSLKKKYRDHLTFIQNNPEKFPLYQELGLEEALAPTKRTRHSDWHIDTTQTSTNPTPGI